MALLIAGGGLFKPVGGEAVIVDHPRSKGRAVAGLEQVCQQEFMTAGGRDAGEIGFGADPGLMGDGIIMKAVLGDAEFRHLKAA